MNRPNRYHSILFVAACALSLAVLPVVGLPYYALGSLLRLQLYGYGEPPLSTLFYDSDQILGVQDTLAVALGDIDNDGDQDALTGHFGAPVAIWLNNGLGIFTASTQMLGTNDTKSYDVALGDLDSDGDLDAIVVNGYGLQTHDVWLNNGSGRFTAGPTPSLAGGGAHISDGKAVVLGDLDGDGDLDAVVGTWRYDAMEVWRNEGNANFSVYLIPKPDQEVWDVALGDLDSDGDLDAALATKTGGQLWRNVGAWPITFSDPPIISDSGQRLGSRANSALGLHDLDGDGDLDALLANSYGSELGNQVWLNDGAGIFVDSNQSLGSRPSEALSIGDVDLDGDADVVFGNNTGLPDAVYFNQGSQFVDGGQNIGAESTADVALADLDNDGDLDLYRATSSAGSPDSVWLNRLRTPLFPVTGRVIGPGGAGLAGTTVTAGAGLSAVSGADGSYRLDLPAGAYSLEARKEGYTFAPASRPITVPPSPGPQDFEAIALQYTVSGRVTGPDGAGLAGATVTAGAGLSAVSGADGSYRLDLPAGAYSLEARKEGYTFAPASRPITVPPSPGPQDFEAIALQYTVSGRVTGPGGAGLAGATVTAGAGLSAVSGADGSYRLDLPAGAYSLEARKEGYTFAPASRPITVPPSPGPQDFEAIALQYTVSGRVIGPDGAGLAGATVTAGAGLSAVSGADGSYRLDLPAGAYSLEARKEGYTFAPASRPITVPPSPGPQDFTSRRITPNTTTIYLPAVQTGPPPSTGAPSGTPAGDAFARANEYRRLAGIVPLRSDATIERGAANHAAYYVTNAETASAFPNGNAHIATIRGLDNVGQAFQFSWSFTTGSELFGNEGSALQSEREIELIGPSYEAR